MGFFYTKLERLSQKNEKYFLIKERSEHIQVYSGPIEGAPALKGNYHSTHVSRAPQKTQCQTSLITHYHGRQARSIGCRQLELTGTRIMSCPLIKNIITSASRNSSARCHLVHSGYWWCWTTYWHHDTLSVITYQHTKSGTKWLN